MLGKKETFSFFILTALLLFSFAARAEESLRLEGVIEDPSNQAESLAVISGSTVKTGDSLGVYRVAKIETGHVTLIHRETSRETVLYLKERELAPAGETKPDTPPHVPVKAARTLMDEAKDYLHNPAKAVNRAWELKGVRDLAVINNAAVKYYEKNQFFPVSMRQLTLDGFLPQEYEKGMLNKYRFYFKNTPMKPDDLQLHADPLENTAGLRSFFIGPDAIIRESSQAPAGSQSAPHEYPGKTP